MWRKLKTAVDIALGRKPSELELRRRERDDQRRRLRRHVDAIDAIRERNACARAASYLEKISSAGVPYGTPEPGPDPSPRMESMLVPVYTTDEATGYPYVPAFERVDVRFEQDPLFGWPADLFGGLDSSFPVGSFPRELYPEKPTTLRTQIAQDAIRFQSRAWYETIPQYSGPIGHLVNYTCGGGMSWDVVAKKKSGADQYEQAAENDGQNAEDTRDDPDKQLAAQVQEWLDAFATYEHNRLAERVEESALNLFRDGEDALRLFPGEEYPQIRSVDTSTIRGPHNEINGPWAFGVLTSWPRDFEDIQAYHCWLPDNTHEDVSPRQLHVVKLWTTGSNVKRGVPLAYKIRRQLPQMAKLLDCMAVGEAARQAIPYLIQYATADKSAVRAATPSTLEAFDAARQEFAALGGGRPGDEIEAPHIPQISKGQEYKDPPNGRAESGAMAYRTLCEAIACALNVPLWFVTGTADSENYASSLVSESPVVKTIGRTQRKITQHYKCILEYVVEMAVAQGKFPMDTLERVEIHCELPSPVARDPEKAIDSDLKLLGKKLLSPQHLCARNDLDFDEEQDLIKQAEEQGWQAPSPLAGENPNENPGAPGSKQENEP